MLAAKDRVAEASLGRKTGRYATFSLRTPFLRRRIRRVAPPTPRMLNEAGSGIVWTTTLSKYADVLPFDRADPSVTLSYARIVAAVPTSLTSSARTLST